MSSTWAHTHNRFVLGGRPSGGRGVQNPGHLTDRWGGRPLETRAPPGAWTRDNQHPLRWPDGRPALPRPLLVFRERGGKEGRRRETRCERETRWVVSPTRRGLEAACTCPVTQQSACISLVPSPVCLRVGIWVVGPYSKYVGGYKTV